MDNRAIGIFDSGVGGLTALKELEFLMPNENVIYFGDTGRLPYGSKSPETVIRYSQQIINFLKSKNVKAILAACGTVSSTASEVGHSSGIPYFDVIDSTCRAAISATRSGKIGVIGTSTTISTGSYRRHMLKSLPDLEIFEQACPMFVSLVENGYISPQDAVTRLVVERSLAQLKANDIDTLILGCTHFPIIAPTISSVMGRGVTLINSGKEAAKSLSAYLTDNGMTNDSSRKAEYEFYLSDTPDGFSSVAEIFLGHSVSGTTQKLNIEDY